MAKYRINKQAEVGMTVNNLFDHRYYESIGSYGTNLENFYGAPRSVAVNLKYAF
jgi:outer membrane receptor for ferric coprogen and ferric-rhodotorulic acid